MEEKKEKGKDGKEHLNWLPQQEGRISNDWERNKK